MAEKANDRISYSIGQKISDNKYGNFDTHISFSSDLLLNETPTEALKRVSSFVEGAVNKRIEHFKKKKDEERVERKKRLMADLESED